MKYLTLTKPTLTKKMTAIAMAFIFATGASFADEIKLAMNGKDDVASNAEAAYAHGFSDSITSLGSKVTIFPSNSIGNEKERLGQVSQGLIQVNLATSSTPISMSPFMRGVTLPFLFNGVDEFDKVMANSDLVERINRDLVPNGVRLMGFNMSGLDAGMHNTNLPVTKLLDMSELRMRAMNASQVKFYSALGASSTIVSWAEVANALQTGIAQGYMNAPNSSIRTGHTQFLKHFTNMAIFPPARPILVSEDWYAGLSTSERANVDAANSAGIAANRAWLVDWADKISIKFSEAGVTVSDLDAGERKKFEAAAASTYAELLSPETLETYKQAIATVRK